MPGCDTPGLETGSCRPGKFFAANPNGFTIRRRYHPIARKRQSDSSNDPESPSVTEPRKTTRASPPSRWTRARPLYHDEASLRRLW